MAVLPQSPDGTPAAIDPDGPWHPCCPACATVQDAARALAEELRKLGETRTARCKETSGWGTCNLPIRENGQFGMPQEHLAAKQA